MKSFESLTTSRTVIRRFQPGDRPSLVELLCDTSVTQNMAFPQEILTKEGVSNLLDMTIDAYDSEKPLLSFAITESNYGFVGVAGFSPLENEEIEVFYALLPKYWGKGFATEVLKGLTAYVFAKTDYKTVVAPITQRNMASIKVAEKNGFLNCGSMENPNYTDLIFLYKKEKS